MKVKGRKKKWDSRDFYGHVHQAIPSLRLISNTPDELVITVVYVYGWEK